MLRAGRVPLSWAGTGGQERVLRRGAGGAGRALSRRRGPQAVSGLLPAGWEPRMRQGMEGREGKGIASDLQAPLNKNSL